MAISSTHSRPRMPATRSRVERRKEKTRRMLIEGARRLFYEKGLHWTKVEDITDRADVGKGTFYRHFETKEALVEEILQEGFDILLARVQAAMDGAEPKSSMAPEIIRAQLGFYLQYPDYLLLFHQIRGLLQRSPAVTDRRESLQAQLERSIQALI